MRSALHGFAQQKTLKESVSCQGIGLDTGIQAKMTLHPAAANTGIVFVRSDIGEDAFVDASWRNVLKLGSLPQFQTKRDIMSVQ